MHLYVRSKRLVVTDKLREHIHDRLVFALGRFAHRIEDVTSSLADMNGPKGGIDKQCRLVVRLRPKGKVTIEESANDLYAAIGRAVDRVGQTVGRHLERRRDAKIKRTGFSPHLAE